MSLSLTVGDLNPLSLTGAKDLASSAKATHFKLGQEFSQFLNQPLSAVPANLSSTDVQYGDDGSSWTPGLGSASPLTFTLGGGGGGKVSILVSGDLLSYTDNFSQTVSIEQGTAMPDKQGPKNISVMPGQAFVAVELTFQISGGLSGTFQQGIYGVSTADAASATVTVAFYKICAPSTIVQDALKQAFEGFVLPLHEKTLEEMEAGDYLRYNFDGNLQLGVGASVGYDRVFYASNTAQAVAGTDGVVTLTEVPSQEAQAGVKLCFGYDYAGTFEALLWREADNKAHLHLYRSAEQHTTVSGGIGLTMTSSTTASMSVATDKLTTLLTQSMPEPLRDTMTSRVLPLAMSEVNNYAGELSSKVAAWLSHVDQEASLDAAIKRSSTRFLLTDYTIDLTNPAYAGAWKLMLQGRFLDAMETPGSGVTLDTGSGMEALFNTAAGIKLNLFGAFHAAWTATTLQDSSLVYAGNNVFHLVTVEGKDVLTVRDATQKEITMYFATEADLSMGGSPVGPPQLHCLLQATNNAGFGKTLGQLAGRLSSQLAGSRWPGQMASVAQQPGGKVALHLIFGPDAYGSLQAAVIQHGKPDDEAKDAGNYAAFANACAALYSSDPQTLMWRGKPLSYALWRNAWIASNDEWPAPDGSVPNRRESAGCGSGVMSQLQQELGVSDSGQAELIFYVLSAAAQFMNLCDDLRTLAAQNVSYTPDTWTSFVKELAQIINKDVSRDFLSATVLGLVSLCGGTPATVTGPVAGLPSGTSLSVTMTYGQAA